ncbi:MAG: hypothetical protein MJ200_00435 [Mycoplasmoidaceae bacterium]|nr:hypothetical protein [Mycoplasmoidaceae bacterium]
MKKIKILTPIFAIATIPSIVTPLTGCKKNGMNYEYDFADKEFEPTITPKKNFHTTESGAIGAYLYDVSQTGTTQIIKEDLYNYLSLVTQFGKEIGQEMGIVYKDAKYKISNIGINETNNAISFDFDSYSKTI